MKLSRNLKRAALVLLVNVVVLNEYFIYLLHSWRWPSLTAVKNNRATDDQVRLLFVADPQLIGVHDDFFMSQLSIYDSDRYLTKTFQYAFNHVQPDLIIFLGDLMDEGSSANDVEYDLYNQRFHQIFRSTHTDVMHIYLPGDNDVGGEAEDEKTEFKVDRFKNYFATNDELFRTKLIDFFAQNYNKGDAVDAKLANHLKEQKATSTAPFRVVLNHINLLSQGRSQFYPFINHTKASLIVSADIHKAKMLLCRHCHDPILWKVDTFAMKSDVVYTFNLHDSNMLREIIVPTCSYRMGVPNMGFGGAVIDRNGEMRYAVLSSPSRYRQLTLYGVVIVIVLFVTFIRSRMFKLGRIRKQV